VPTVRSTESSRRASLSEFRSLTATFGSISTAPSVARWRRHKGRFRGQRSRTAAREWARRSCHERLRVCPTDRGIGRRGRWKCTRSVHRQGHRLPQPGAIADHNPRLRSKPIGVAPNDTTRSAARAMPLHRKRTLPSQRRLTVRPVVCGADFQTCTCRLEACATTGVSNLGLSRPRVLGAARVRPEFELRDRGNRSILVG